MKKNTFIKWLIIILVIINISALSSFFYAKVIGEKSNIPSLEAEDVVVDQLGFDQAQLLQYTVLKEKYDTDVAGIRLKMHENMNLMLAEVSRKTPDTLAISNYAERFGNYQAELKLRTMHHFIELKKLAKPGQEVKFDGLFRQLQHRNRGMGRGQGRGRGLGRGQGSGMGNSNLHQNNQPKDTSSEGWDTY